MASNRKSDMKKVRDSLAEQGFAVELVNNGHWKVTSPDGQRTCQIAATPRESRAILNAITRLKRIGYVPPDKNHKPKDQR
jgi:hypothetical protein